MAATRSRTGRTAGLGPDGRRHRSARRARLIGAHAAVQSLGEGLFELRFTLGPTARRITYRFTNDGRIVLLTTFRKQRNNERTEMTASASAADSTKDKYVDKSQRCSLTFPR